MKRLFSRYRAMGLRDVEMKLYEGSRHEILNDLEREKVCEDLKAWMFRHMGR